MNSHYDYLDGNAAAGELSSILSDGCYDCREPVCELRRNQTLCRGSCVYAGSWNRGTLRHLRTRTPPNRKCSSQRCSRRARYDVPKLRHIATSVVRFILQLAVEAQSPASDWSLHVGDLRTKLMRLGQRDDRFTNLSRLRSESPLPNTLSLQRSIPERLSIPERF